MIELVRVSRAAVIAVLRRKRRNDTRSPLRRPDDVREYRTIDETRLRALHKMGDSDCMMAQVMRFGYKDIRKARERLGLPANYKRAPVAKRAASE